MLRSFTKRYVDTSTADQYSFVFYCDISDYHWASVPITKSRQSNHGLLSYIRNKCSGMREREQAFERANHEAMMHFNRCTQCYRWVCDDMFIDETSICTACAKERENLHD